MRANNRPTPFADLFATLHSPASPRYNLAGPIYPIFEAALQLGANAKRYTYREAIAHGARFRPLVFSSGGTLHKEFFEYLKAMIQDPQVRSNLCTDVSIALVRARAELLSARAR
jgi:hypothetical protein